MKKFLVLLCVGCLMVGGCGQSSSKDSATESQTDIVSDAAIYEDTDVTSNAAVESDEVVHATDVEGNETDDIAEEEQLVDEYGMPIDPSSPVAHIVTTHADKNAEPDNSVDYFPDITGLYDLETGTRQAMLYSDDYKQYNYTIEHRTFDFLKEGDTAGNFEAIGSYIKNEYLDEMGSEAKGFVELLSGYDDMNYCYKVTFLANADKLPEQPKELTDESMAEYIEQIEAMGGEKYNGFVIYRTVDDPNNGVTILYVENADKFVLTM